MCGVEPGQSKHDGLNSGTPGEITDRSNLQRMESEGGRGARGPQRREAPRENKPMKKDDGGAVHDKIYAMPDFHAEANDPIG